MALVAGTAVVTGGGSGIGKAIALALAAAGAPVAALDIFADTAEQTAAEIRAAGGRASAAQCDVSDETSFNAAVDRALAELGPMGIMVNAAGILDGYGTVSDIDYARFSRVIAINLGGTYLGCRRAVRELAERGGRIINMASIAGLVGAGGGPAYIASKHGVVGITRNLAVTHAPQGITVNALCPGPITTALRPNSQRVLGMPAGAPPMGGVGASEDAIRALIPVGRRGTVEEVAALACFLASDQAGYITGQTLVIDGGWTAR